MCVWGGGGGGGGGSSLVYYEAEVWCGKAAQNLCKLIIIDLPVWCFNAHCSGFNINA